MLEPVDNRLLANLCGQFDEHLRQIERRLGVHISNRGNHFKIIGPQQSSRAGARVLRELYEMAGDEELDPQQVHVCLQESAVADESGADAVAQNSQIVKTRRIVLVRPAVEAGERLGFLPGDMSQKVDPYLRPMYDALYEMLGFDRVARLVERSVIEIAPLAFMRGRSLNESFVILDEAQNTTVEQMKMFLTRMGFGSRAVVTGDVTQVDLPPNQTSGLRHVIRVLDRVPGVAFTFFTARDVIRHPLVQRIVEAYERLDAADGSA